MDTVAVVLMGAGVFLLWTAYKGKSPVDSAKAVIAPQKRTPQAAG